MHYEGSWVLIECVHRTGWAYTEKKKKAKRIKSTTATEKLLQTVIKQFATWRMAAASKKALQLCNCPLGERKDGRTVARRFMCVCAQLELQQRSAQGQRTCRTQKFLGHQTFHFTPQVWVIDSFMLLIANQRAGQERGAKGEREGEHPRCLPAIC